MCQLASWAKKILTDDFLDFRLIFSNPIINPTHFKIQKILNQGDQGSELEKKMNEETKLKMERILVLSSTLLKII